ncbi:MAG: PH domain-containing protein [Pseudomonadales bacterium]
MDIFAISPASAKPLWFLAIICALLAVVLAVLAYTAYASRHSRVEVENNRIKLVGDFWGREIPFSRLEVSGARILDLTRNSEYSPKRRTFGTGLPGYASGWFRLRSGEKALVYLTKRRDVVYLPTSDGYSLLLSVEEPESFIETLQQYSP